MIEKNRPSSLHYLRYVPKSVFTDGTVWLTVSLFCAGLFVVGVTLIEKYVNRSYVEEDVNTLIFLALFGFAWASAVNREWKESAFFFALPISRNGIMLLRLAESCGFSLVWAVPSLLAALILAGFLSSFLQTAVLIWLLARTFHSLFCAVSRGTYPLIEQSWSTSAGKGVVFSFLGITLILLVYLQERHSLVSDPPPLMLFNMLLLAVVSTGLALGSSQLPGMPQSGEGVEPIRPRERKKTYLNSRMIQMKAPGKGGWFSYLRACGIPLLLVTVLVGWQPILGWMGTWRRYHIDVHVVLDFAVAMTGWMIGWVLLWVLMVHFVQRSQLVMLWQKLPARSYGPAICVVSSICICLVAFLAMFGEGWKTHNGQPIMSLAKSATFFPVVAAAVCYLTAPITQQGTGPEMTRMERLYLALAILICAVGLLALPFLQWGHIPFHRGLFVVSLVYGTWYTFWLYKRY